MNILPKIYTNSNPIIRNCIIHLGCSVFYNLGFDIKNESEILNSLKQYFHIENNNEDYKDIIKEKSNYIKDLELMLHNKEKQDKLIVEENKVEIRNELKKQIQKEQQILYDRINDLQQNIKDKDEINNLLQNEKNKLEDELKLLQDKKDFKNNSEKGKYFEDIIQDNSLVQIIDPKAYVIDSTKEGGSGDKIIHFPSDDIKMMVECKYTNKISDVHMEQFENHWQNDIPQKKYDIAVLISYDTELILKKGRCPIPYYEENNSVVYFGLDSIYSPEEKKKRITNNLREIITKFSKQKKESNEIQNENINFFHKYLEQIKIKKDECSLQLKTNNDIQEKLSKEYEKLEKEWNELLKYATKNNISIKQSFINKDTNKKNNIDIIFQCIKENNIKIQKNFWKKNLKKDLEPFLEQKTILFVDKIKLKDIPDFNIDS